MRLTSEDRKRLSGAGAPKPRAMPLKEALRYSGWSRSTFYRFAGEGRIELRKVGRSSVVLTESLDALLDSLPRATIRPPRKGGRCVGDA